MGPVQLFLKLVTKMEIASKNLSMTKMWPALLRHLNYSVKQTRNARRINRLENKLVTTNLSVNWLGFIPKLNYLLFVHLGLKSLDSFPGNTIYNLAKGQVILKANNLLQIFLFSFQPTTERNYFLISALASKRRSVRFLVQMRTRKFAFKINWPLAGMWRFIGIDACMMLWDKFGHQWPLVTLCCQLSWAY